MIRTDTWSTNMVGSLYPTRVGYFKRIVTVIELIFFVKDCHFFRSDVFKWSAKNAYVTSSFVGVSHTYHIFVIKLQSIR